MTASPGYGDRPLQVRRFSHSVMSAAAASPLWGTGIPCEMRAGTHEYDHLADVRSRPPRVSDQATRAPPPTASDATTAITARRIAEG
jgi:hypothetical protein